MYIVFSGNLVCEFLLQWFVQGKLETWLAREADAPCVISCGPCRRLWVEQLSGRNLLSVPALDLVWRLLLLSSIRFKVSVETAWVNYVFFFEDGDGMYST